MRVNAIVPGYITSDMTAGKHGMHHVESFLELCSTYTLTDMDSESLLSQIPAHRFGKPEEVADAALFLARNQYANNCVINIDGGLSAV